MQIKALRFRKSEIWIQIRVNLTVELIKIKRNLNKKNSSIFDDRFISLFYFNCSTYGTLGDALIYPISMRARLYTSFYILLVGAGLLTALTIN